MTHRPTLVTGRYKELNSNTDICKTGGWLEAITLLFILIVLSEIVQYQINVKSMWKKKMPADKPA